MFHRHNRRSRNLISLSLVLVAGFVSLFLALKLSVSPGNHTIVLSDEGFYPEEITIQKGEVVRFVTERDKEFWPASNLHPTHEIYSEFDSKEPPNLSLIHISEPTRPY